MACDNHTREEESTYKRALLLCLYPGQYFNLETSIFLLRAVEKFVTRARAIEREIEIEIENVCERATKDSSR